MPVFTRGTGAYRPTEAGHVVTTPRAFGDGLSRITGFLVSRFALVWGLGIGSVMLIAVGPYPVMGLVVDDEIPHRIHNIVGAVQYLPLWAVPVLLFTFGRDRAPAWRVALASSVVMAAVGVWSGDLIESLSWMPLVTLLPLWPRDVAWRPDGWSAGPFSAFLLVGWVAIANTPDAVNLQRLDLADSHSARFHFSGMAAAYLALLAAVGLLTLFRSGFMLRAIVAVSALVSGACSLVWSDYTSALGGRDAWLLVAASPLVLVPGHRVKTPTFDPHPDGDEIIGVYDADSTVVGELSYWIGARFGRRHCALCDITHGTFSVKKEWQECELRLATPFRTYHRNDAPADVLECAAGVYPIVLRRESGRLSVLMTPDELDRFDGSVDAFARELSVVLSAGDPVGRGNPPTELRGGGQPRG